MNNSGKQSKAAILRQNEKLKLIHELEVHQIELETQNEELMEARSAAQDAIEKYKNLYNFAPLGYFTLSKEGKIIELNHFGSKMLDKERSRLQNSSFGFFITNETRPVFNAFLTKVFESETKETCEVVLITNDKLPIYVHLTGIVAKNEEQCLVTAIDITEHKQTEAELSENEKKYRNIYENAQEGIFQTKINGTYISVNPALAKMYGFESSEELINSRSDISNDSYYDPKERDNFLRIMEKQGFIKGYEYEVKHKDGHKIWFYEDAKAIKDKNGKTQYFEGFVVDITERKQTEQELINAKKKAEESDRLKTAFLANMSHEIRTPMNGILGFTELMKEPNLTGEEQQKYIGIIEKSGARMLNIINDIISISKVESGQMEICISETNISEQIEYIYTFFKPEVERKGIKIFLKNSLPAKEATIKTDREKVYAILTNLVKNAIKFTSEGYIEIGYEKKGKYLEFFVKDTGTGIPQEQKELIFERFRQGSESLTRSYEGAGLGLSISKAYVDMLGGKIWVVSKLEKGSVFYFTVPYNSAQEEETIKNVVSVDGEERQIKDLKVLIADDDEISEMLISVVVKKLSKEVLKVRTGVEAIETCRSNPDIDLVLMDMKMPETDGYEATRQIRQFNKDVIIIAQTAFGLTGDREKAIEAGCNDYISKPINQSIFKNLLKKHFNKQ